jgi:hypothetical protein
MDAPKPTETQKEDDQTKSQPWKQFFQVAETNVGQDGKKAEKSEIRLLPQRDDKDLGG